jgi:hypothetical protein
VSNGRSDHRSSATAKSAVALPYYRTFSTDHLDQYSSTGKSCWQQDRLAPECGGCRPLGCGHWAAAAALAPPAAMRRPPAASQRAAAARSCCCVPGRGIAAAAAGAHPCR